MPALVAGICVFAVDCSPVMPALVAGIHVLQRRSEKDVDGRDKPGHDDVSGMSVQPPADERVSTA
jgi:hypothetical protein